MKIGTFVALGVLVGASLAAVPARAQQPPAAPANPSNPTPGCSVTPAELAANKKTAMEFFRTIGDGRVALIDPNYIQHNPVAKKGATDAKVSDYEEFKTLFSSASIAAGRGGPGAGGPPPAGRGAAGPRPPAGNPFEVVTAECDIVTMVHKNYRPDPTAEGKFYEAYTFDTFRVKNGKLVEHWDGALIPAAPAGGRQ